MGRRALRTAAPLNAMKKNLFRSLAKLNKLLLPKLWNKDLTRLSKGQKVLIGWRYYVTRNAL